MEVETFLLIGLMEYSSPNISGLSAGTYTLTVTDNNTGCITTDSVTLQTLSIIRNTNQEQIFHVMDFQMVL